MLQRIVYSRFAHSGLKLDELDQAPLEPFPTRPDSQFRWKILFSEHACQAVIEDWYKGHDIEWTYFVDALFHVISGEAELTLWQPPNWTEKHVVMCRPGRRLPLPARRPRHLQDDQRGALPAPRLRHPQPRLRRRRAGRGHGGARRRLTCARRQRLPLRCRHGD